MNKALLVQKVYKSRTESRQNFMRNVTARLFGVRPEDVTYDEKGQEWVTLGGLYSKHK
jgi:hypothetical protein